MTTRREMMVGSVASLAGLMMRHDETKAKAPAHQTVGFHPMIPRGCEAEVEKAAECHDNSKHVKEIVDVLLEFRHVDGWEMPSAVSIPRATLPLNVYMRSPKEVLDNIPPKLHRKMKKTLNPVVINLAMWGDPWTPQAIVSNLWSHLAPEFFHQVEKCEAIMPGAPRCYADRITTPKYIIDVDELDCIKLAQMLISAVEDPLKEIDIKMRVAYKHAKQTMKKERMQGYFEHTPPILYVKREVFMLEMFCYLTSNGFIWDTANHPRWSVNAPLGTLPLNRFEATDDDGRNFRQITLGNGL